MKPLKRFMPLSDFIAARRVAWVILAPFALAPIANAEEEETSSGPKPVSYYTEVRPLFQAKCQGCHQPAKAKGGFVMTDFAKLVAGGDSDEAAIVPGDPDKSFLVEQITPIDGEAEMPPKDGPLHETEIELVRKWVAEGAVDDTPENARQRYTADNPPVIPVLRSSPHSTTRPTENCWRFPVSMKSCCTTQTAQGLPLDWWGCQSVSNP